MEQRQGQRSTSSTFAVAAAICLAVAVSLFVLGAGSTVAAKGRNHHHHRHHHSGVHVPREFLGVLSGPTPFDPTDAAKIKRTGVKTVRIALPWLSVQRVRGPFDWAGSDRMIARLAANGIHILPTLAGTPRWIATPGTTPPLMNEAAQEAWQTFVTAAVRRYGDDGTFWRPSPGSTSPFHLECGCDARPVPITAWQIWNEPNLRKYFRPKSPKQYAKLVKLSRTAISQADSTAKLVLAGLADGGDPGKPGAIPYLKSFYRIPGIKQSFDVLAIHPYARNVNNLRRVMKRFRSVMTKKHDKQTPLWVTEMGWGSGHPTRYGHTKGIRGQRKILQKSIELLAEKRKTWRVQHAYWFFWRDPKTTGHLSCSFCTSAGLLRQDRRPKPAYRAFKRLANSAR
jgi:Glycosyl hydrolase catalytic core/Beta-galactosidase